MCQTNYHDHGERTQQAPGLYVLATHLRFSAAAAGQVAQDPRRGLRRSQGALLVAAVASGMAHANGAPPLESHLSDPHQHMVDGVFTPKNILLTGGCGFIGSHVAIRLLKRYPQYKIVIYDSMEYCASMNNLSEVLNLPNFKHVKGDIQVADLVRYVLETEEIDTIMHFAAQTHVDNSFGNSMEFTMGNTYGTHVMLECARAYGRIKRFINVSTDEVYGESSLGKAEGLDEGSRLEPTNPYSAAKAGAEMMCKAYMTSYRLPIIITRGNNVYGPHQFPEKMIPKFTLLAMRGQELPVHGDGLAVRSYLYVEDVAAAFDTVLHKGLLGEVYNIGTQIERSVTSVARDIAAATGLPEGRIVHVRDRAFNDRRYFICDKKLLNLGWKEATSWEEGLAKTIAWYRDVGGQPAYWENGDLESALQAHPQLQKGLLGGRPPAK